jgi:hypothetical protein
MQHHEQVGEQRRRHHAPIVLRTGAVCLPLY